ncbi:1581_t:CDS:2, partial [Ambispora leptoticha]
MESGPLVTNNSLIINRNSIVVHDGTDIITLFQYVPETDLDLPTQHLENVDDFTEVKEEVFIRHNPLVRINFKEKLREIVSQLKEESHRKLCDQQIRMLETSYYLEQLKKEADSSKEKIQKIHNNLKKALGPRCAAQAWKCAEQIYQLLQ